MNDLVDVVVVAVKKVMMQMMVVNFPTMMSSTMNPHFPFVCYVEAEWCCFDVNKVFFW